MIRRLFICLIITASAQSQATQIKNFEDSTFLDKRAKLEDALITEEKSIISLRYYELGAFLHQSDIYTEAVEHYNLALDHINKPDRDTLSVIIRNRLGEIHLFLKNYDKAEGYLTESIELAKAMGFEYGMAKAESILGSCHEKKGDYLSALQYQQKSLTFFEASKDSAQIGLVLEHIGSIYEDLGEFEKASQYFHMAFEHLQAVGSSHKIHVLNNIGDTFRKTGDYPQALHYTGKALELAEQQDEDYETQSALKDLSLTYELMGDYQNSYTFLKAHTEAHKEALYADNFRQLNVLEAIHDTKEKEAHIILLQQQNKISRANQQLLILGVVMFFALSGASYLHYDKKRKSKLKLQEYEQQLLETKLEQRAVEQKRMQDEIHIKTASLSKYSLNIAQKNKLLSDLSSTLKNLSGRPKMDHPSQLKQLVRELDDHLYKEEEWDEFLSFFREIHPNFIKKLSESATANLSSAELRLAMLLRLNLSSKEIAAILRVTSDSVRVARYRLRKKLPIEPKQELMNFMLNL